MNTNVTNFIHNLSNLYRNLILYMSSSIQSRDLANYNIHLRTTITLIDHIEYALKSGKNDIEIANMVLGGDNSYLITGYKDILSEDGKIILNFNTSNKYKVKSFEDFFKYNEIGCHLAEIFEINTVSPLKTTEETTTSMMLNAVNKAKDIKAIKELKGFFIGDDSGIVSTMLSGLVVNNNLSTTANFPGVVSKRIGNSEIINNYLENLTISNNIKDLINLAKNGSIFDPIKDIKDSFNIHKYNSAVLIYLYLIITPVLAELVGGDIGEAFDNRIVYTTNMVALRKGTDTQHRVTEIAEGYLELEELTRIAQTLTRFSEDLSDHTTLIYHIARLIDDDAQGYNGIIKINDAYVDNMSSYELANTDHRSRAILSLLTSILVND